MKHIVRIGLGCLLASIAAVAIATGLERLGIRGEGVHLGTIALALFLTSFSDRELFWPSASDRADGHRSGSRAE